MSPFHLAIPVSNLEATRAFYVDVLGVRVGRASARWLDFDFWGHQVTTHLVDAMEPVPFSNPVDGEAVPVRHFGVVLPWDAWEALVERLRGMEVSFLLGPTIRFEGKVGEQATFFVRDPSGNALEFKAFRDLGQLFASDETSGAKRSRC